jgi:SSS family transporter
MWATLALATMGDVMSGVLLGILVYLVVQFAIAIVVSRRIKSETDYILGGRQIGVGLATFSVFATWFGAETVLGSAGRVYSDGLSGAQGEPFAYALSIVIMGALFAARLWRRGLVTFGDMFRGRFSLGVERLTVILLVPGSVLWAAAQIRGFGQIMGATTGMDLATAITVAAVIVIVYTAIGGLLADVYSDFVHGIAIIIGLVAMLVFVLIEVGGPAQALAGIEAARFAPMGPDQSLLSFVEQWAIPICGSLVAVELISRVLACKSADVARTATCLGGVGYLLVALIPVFFGLVGAQLAPGLDEAEQIVPTLAQKYLPTAIFVMYAGALISAILTTVDSALLAAASLLSHNIVLRLKPDVSESGKVALARGGVALLGLVAFALALQSEAISDLVELASAFATAGIFVAFAFGLFTGWGGAASAYAAIVAGAVVWAGGKYLLELEAPYVTGVLAAVAAYAAVAVAARLVTAESRA